MGNIWTIRALKFSKKSIYWMLDSPLVTLSHSTNSSSITGPKIRQIKNTRLLKLLFGPLYFWRYTHKLRQRRSSSDLYRQRVKIQERCTTGLCSEHGTEIDLKTGRRNSRVTTAFLATILALLWQSLHLNSSDLCPK